MLHQGEASDNTQGGQHTGITISSSDGSSAIATAPSALSLRVKGMILVIALLQTSISSLQCVPNCLAASGYPNPRRVAGRSQKVAHLGAGSTTLSPLGLGLPPVAAIDSR